MEIVGFLDQRVDPKFIDLWVNNQLMGSFTPAGAERFLQVIFDNKVTCINIIGRNYYYENT